MARHPRVLTAEEAARRDVHDGTLPKGSPFVCADGRKICGAKLRGCVGPKGERFRCENQPDANGRCRLHSGSRTNPGVAPSDKTLAERAFGIIEAGAKDANLLSALGDLERFEHRRIAIEMKIAEAREVGNAEEVAALTERYDNLVMRRDHVRKNENKRIIDGEEMITRRQHVAALTVLLGTALEVAYAFISLDRQAEYRRALHKQVASYIS